MNEQLTQLRESLGSWAKIVQSNTEQRIARALFRSVLNTSGIGGTFSGWLLAISGATIGLAFTNLESVSQILSPHELRAAFGFLFVSCVAGFFARIAGSYVDLYRQLIADLEPTIEAILDEHAAMQEDIKKTAGTFVDPPALDPDLKRAIDQLLECIPPYFRKRALRNFEKGKADPLFIYKRATKIYLGQGLVVVAQVILFAFFVAVVFAAI